MKMSVLSFFKRKKEPKKITVKDILRHKNVMFPLEEIIELLSMFDEKMSYYDLVEKLHDKGFSDFKIGFYVGMMMAHQRIISIEENEKREKKKINENVEVV